MAFIPSSGSVAAWLQSDNASVITLQQGSVAAVIVGGSIAGVANQSVSGTVHVDNIGSVIATQLAGSVMAVSGSFTPAANQSVSGAVSVSNFPTTQNVSGSVVAFPTGQYTVVSSLAGGIFPVSGSVAAVITNSPTVLVNNGSVVSFQSGTRVTSLVSTVPSSVMVGASIFGQLPAGTAMLGSVAAYQGAVPWVVNFQNSSIIAINAGSVIAIPAGSVITVLQAPSIVGTYAEDAASASGDKGLFNLGVRNDTLSSLVSADLDYGGQAQDAMGRQIIKPFASEDATIISFTGSVVSGSVTLIQASALGKKSYITDYWITNTGSTLGVVTFKDGSASVIGYGSAPATSGSNSQGINIPLKTANAQDLTFSVSPSQSILYLTVKGYQAQ